MSDLVLTNIITALTTLLAGLVPLFLAASSKQKEWKRARAEKEIDQRRKIYAKYSEDLAIALWRGRMGYCQINGHLESLLDSLGMIRILGSMGTASQAEFILDIISPYCVSQDPLPAQVLAQLELLVSKWQRAVREEIDVLEQNVS